MNVLKAIYQRRSIRKFQDKSVEKIEIEELLKAAMAAPSGRNLQPWLFYVVENKTIQKQLNKMFKDFNAQAFIIVAGDNTLRDKDKEFWVQDCSAAIQNILLAAVELGLGTCWCGIYPKEIETREVQKLLSLNKDTIPLALIQLGYPDEEKEARTQYDENKVIYIK